MKAFFSPFRSLALLSTLVALHASCSLIANSQLEDKPPSSSLSSSSGDGGTGNGGTGGVGGGGSSVGGGGSGACGGTCVDGEMCCKDACFSLQTDVNHCGMCDNACASSEKCCGGTCAACCGDPDCPTTDHHCVSGTCVLECLAPKVECDGACAILMSDPKNCGACGTDCLSGHACVAGECQSGWATMSEAGALSPRQRAAAAWTGSKLFIWGGQNPQGSLDDGALYDPKTDTWTMLPTTNAPTARVDAVAIATNGDKVLVWGGGPDSNNQGQNTGKLYDLVTSAWIDVAVAPIGRRNPVAAWTGSKVLLWGGTSGGAAIAGGALYDPALNKWSVMANANAPSSRTGVGSAWSGTELLIFGGRPGGAGTTNEGYGYNPETNAWRKLSSSNAPTARFDTFAGWTGTSLFVVGGRDAGAAFADAGIYNPAADAWTPAMTCPLGKRSAPAPRTGWVASGSSKILVAGGLDETQAIKVDGRVYDSVVNDWGAQSLAWPSGVDHEYGVGIWTGTEFILWSGLDNSVLTPVGERYRP